MSHQTRQTSTRLAKSWTAIDRLSVIWKLYLTDKIKRSFFQGAVVSILLYGRTTWTLTKRMEKKLDSNYTRMLQAILNKTLWQHPTKQLLFATYHPPRKLSKLDEPDMQDTAGEVRRNSHDTFMVPFTWTGKSRTYIQQLCADTGYSLENMLGAMDDRDVWWERVRDIRVGIVTWLWWYMFIDYDCENFTKIVQ